ncbi:MAG: LamG-like jellyroll fold domain-containing protein, partial [Phycisphaeraceae bacterium]
AAFINPNSFGGDRTILGNDPPNSNHNSLHLVTRGNTAHLGFFGNDTPGVQNLSGQVNSWIHVAYQYDNGTQRIFVNGVQDNQTGGHIPFQGTAKNVLLGRWNNGNFFNGEIDNLAIYNTALSQADIAHLAASGDPQNLVTPQRYLNPLNGQYYEVGPGGTFAQAKAAAEAMSLNGHQGQMAQVDNAQENRFLTGLFGPNVPNVVDQAWIGLTDNATFGGSESQGTANNQINGWVWTTPGGPVTLASTGFQRWNGGEPNDFNSNEDAGQLTDVNVNNQGGVWNDIPLTGTQNQTFVEYLNAPPSFGANMRVVYSAGTVINNLATADSLLAGGIAANREAEATIYAVNFLNTGGDGHFFGNHAFPGEISYSLTPGASGDDNFAVQVTGHILIHEAGAWTFGTNADDGTRLIIDGQLVINDGILSGPHDAFGVFNAPSGGVYSFELTYFENLFGGELEFFAAQGVHSTFNAELFRLVGDTFHGGLAFSAPVPEPTTAMLGLLALAGLGRRRQRAA